MLKIFLVLNAFLMSHQVLAWGDLAHEAVGEIAERNLTPKAKAFVVSILGVETLAYASIFPDIVRPDKRFLGYNPYHFLAVPYGKRYEGLSEEEKVDKDANVIIQKAKDVFTNPAYSQAQKSLMLKYLIHVVGDVHQPLHVGNGDDIGANLCYVFVYNKSKLEKVNLHYVWDILLVEEIKRNFLKEHKNIKHFTYSDFVGLILSENKGATALNYQSVSQEPIMTWYQESQQLHSRVYPDKKETAPNQRSYCKKFDEKTKQVINGNYDESKLPILNQKYINESLKIIKKQILKGGYHLAALLNKIATSSTIDENDDRYNVEKILKSMEFGKKDIPIQ